jgi:DegV family protein with EDD domain
MEKKDFIIVADGGSDLTEEAAQELGVILTPLHIIFGGTEDLRDKIDITTEEFVRRLDTEPELPTTSGSSVADMLEGYEKAFERANSVISIHVATELSVCMRSATQARQQMADRDITVIDSRTVAGPQGLLVIAAAKAAQAGASKEEVIDLVNSLIPKSNIFLTMETLKYLLAGGRITVTQAFMANLLGLRPIVQIRDGVMAPAGRERGKKRAILKILKMVEEDIGGRDAKVNFIVNHVQALDEAQELKATIENRFNCQDEVRIFELGAATGTHAGPGALTVAYQALE